eukprot:193562-Pyramimonas_sp.AAC.1
MPPRRPSRPPLWPRKAAAPPAPPPHPRGRHLCVVSPAAGATSDHREVQIKKNNGAQQPSRANATENVN